jgi:hypothetical protein
MGTLLLAHKVSLELTFSTQHKEYLESTNLTKRGWGEQLSLRACKEWLRSSAKSPRTVAFVVEGLGYLYPSKEKTSR